MGLCIASVFVGCADPQAGRLDSPPYSARDSAGVAIIETASSVARTPIGWVIDTVPEMAVGEVDGPAEHLFSRILGAAMLQNGRLAVLDGASLEVRFFDEAGVYVGKVGRPGQGPGEFQAPGLAGIIGGDSLLIFDRRSSRFTVIDGTTLSSRTDPPILGARGGALKGIAGDRVLRLFMIYMPPPDPPGLFGEMPFIFTSIGRSSGSIDTLARYEVPRYFVDRTASQTMLPVPFTVHPDGVTLQDAFVVLPPEATSLMVYSPAGQLMRIYRLAESLQSVTADDIDRFARHESSYSYSGTPAAMTERYRDMYGRIPIPSTKPVFRSLIADELGWLWVETYRSEDGSQSCGARRSGTPCVWMVIDPEGNIRGTVEMKPGLQVFQIAEDFVLGRWRDEYGVESVRSYRLRR